MTVFTCRDHWEDMMTCIYEAWASKLGHQNIRLELEPVEQRELFCEYIHIDADTEKAGKVVSSIRKKISWKAYRQVFYAAHASIPQKLECIYRFLILGFHFGNQVTEMMTDPTVMELFEMSRRVGNEAHYMREFARFTCHDNQFYVCHMEPEHDILLMLAEHFADRMPSENWMILDDRRGTAVIHPKDQKVYQKELSEKEQELLHQTEEMADHYTRLWKEFFHTIGIEERKNPVCQRNHMPLRYRKHVTEFCNQNTNG